MPAATPVSPGGAGLIALLFLLGVASGLAVVEVRHETRQEFVRLQVLESERNERQVAWGRLQLEQAAVAEPWKIETRAREGLGMVHPEPDKMVVFRQ